LAVIFLAAMSVRSQSVQHLTTPQPGGIPGLPVIGGIEQLTNGVRINWDGPSGYYQVYQKGNSLNAPWMAVGKANNLDRYAVITQSYSNAFFRVSGPAPKYAGAQVCVTCHSSICRYEANTPHASAFSSANFAALGGQTNSSCLACHTVGYGLPTGFVSASKTPLLEGVQCENCHGPAANHANAPDDPTLVPQVEIAATLCGGCHTTSHTSYTTAPTFDEWSTSGHAAVVPHVLAAMSSSTSDIRSCGVCHSGSARLMLINGADPAVFLTKDYDMPITCAVCHDPHATNANPAQLRDPVASTNQFHFLSSDVATVAAFTAKYNSSTKINLCAQCHNDRGAAWMDTTNAPHHSLQYNFLLGSVGELFNGRTNLAAVFNPGPHSGLPSSASGSISKTFYLTNQCVACHMQSDPVVTSAHNHTFTPSYNVCLNCHDGQAAQAALTSDLSNQVATVITLLNEWAAFRAPPPLRTNGIVAWEYSTSGGLTWTTNSAGFVTSWSLTQPANFTGPDAAGQALIPDNIKRARFDLYLVLNDGSFGVHNPPFARHLLYFDGALGFLYQELYN
jgi:Cytochrome c554 and c-prime